MTQDESKRKAAEAALPYIKDVSILGVGTGSTVNHFIDCLADFNLTNDIKGAVSSSIATTERLKNRYSSDGIKRIRQPGCLCRWC